MDSKIRLLGLVSVACLAVAGCDDKGSLGEYPETEGGSTGGDDSAGTTGGPGGTSTSNGSQTASGEADSGIESESATATDGQEVCGGEEGNCQLYPIECGEGFFLCGELDAIFDDEGCLRQFCSNDDECGADERCYRPQDFGGCVGSGVWCEDDLELQMCSCGGLADCGGAYCVPAELYPQPTAGPEGETVITESCAPNDGPAFEIMIGLPDTSCGQEVPVGTPSVEIDLWVADLAPGEYPFGNLESPSHYAVYRDGMGGEMVAVDGLVQITGNDAGGVAGTWEMSLGDESGTFIGGAFQAPVPCGALVICG